MTAREFLTDQEQADVIASIAQAEKGTSGEIRVHLENLCLGNPLKAARKVFVKLKMHETAARNGMLIYIAAMSHKAAIVGDEGIHAKVGQHYWDGLAKQLMSDLREGKRKDGIVKCVLSCGAALAQHFPRQADDRNELSDHISY